ADGVEAPRLVGGAARASATPGGAGPERPADRRQLADLRVGGEQRTHAGSEPGLLHQSAGQCAARPAGAARTTAPPAVAGGGAGGAGRAAADLAAGQPALGLAGPGVDLRRLRADPQAGPGGGATRSGGGNLDAAADRAAVAGLASGGRQRPARVL